MSGRFASAVAGCAAIAALTAGVVFGTYAAGGSDSSCYLNAARLLARGAVGLEQPLVRDAPWPNAQRTFTPAGFTASPIDPAFLVPICSPGLSLTMAAFRVLRVSEFLVVPFLGALAVWLTYLIGRRIHGATTGAAAAALLVCSPTFLYQVVQPMSDVPAMAWWLLALACAIEQEDGSNRPGLAGLAASMALLTRPNLLPLTVVIALYLRVVCGRGGRSGGVVRFGAGLVPGIALLALLQHAMYGSPLATGYGSMDAVMTAGHVVPNLRRYLEWLIGSHTPFLLLSLAAPAVVRPRRHAWLGLAFAGATLTCYLPYLVFDDWWYTRFLLPAIPLLIVLSVATLVTLVERFTARVQRAVIAFCVIVMMAWWFTIARDRHAFGLADLERHFVQAGTAVAEHVPDLAAIVTVKNSGSVHYYADRPTISWDTLDRVSLDQALDFVRARGYQPYLLLETEEEPAFRERFQGASVYGNLDWPPRVQAGRRIRIYDPLDRARFLADGKVRTEFVNEAPASSRGWRRWFGTP